MELSFAQLHRQQAPLLLPNAWDVASALAFADAGFAAVGTTSFGVAASSGTPDSGRTSKSGTTALAKALEALPAYVSVDIEDGYSDDPEEVAEYVASLSVAGVNIEDSTAERLIDPMLHAAKIVAIKERCPEVFVNARPDNYWIHQDATVDAVLTRAAIYTYAGADGIFTPGVTDADEIRILAESTPVPLNVLAHPVLTLGELGELGVRRVSTGSLPYRAAIDAAVKVADTLRSGQAAISATPYDTMQNRLIAFRQRKSG